MRPWIEKKLIEYLGEEEPTLTEYITTLIKQHKSPEDIMNEVGGWVGGWVGGCCSCLSYIRMYTYVCIHTFYNHTGGGHS
jgi:hypothetical protein